MNVPFTPDHTRKAEAGWTVERQQSFIRHLATHGSVTQAAAFVGVHPSSAYRLRARSKPGGFAYAWAKALAAARQNLLGLAMDRAINGSRRQFWQGGKLVGEQVTPSDRLLIFLLTQYPSATVTGQDIEHCFYTLEDEPLETDETQQRDAPIPAIATSSE